LFGVDSLDEVYYFTSFCEFKNFGVILFGGDDLVVYIKTIFERGGFAGCCEIVIL
jgi:hypothetical protein